MKKKKETKNQFKFLEDLCLAPSPSSYEVEAIKIWEKYMGDLKECSSGYYLKYTDNLRNSCYSLGNGGPRKVLFSAHIDSVCARVTKIDKNGTLLFNQSGGICLKSLISSDVLVLGRKGWVPGVVSKVALHLDEQRDKVGEFTNYRINLGYQSADKVKELGIYPGSLVIYMPEINTNFGEDYICGTGLDDKAGMYIVYEIARKLIDIWNNNLDTKYTIYFAAMTQEEVGAVGAKRATHNLDPNVSIDFDCTFADTDLIESKKFTALKEISLGSGPLVAYGADKSLELNDKLVEILEDLKMPYQTYATQAGGTNTRVIQDFSSDCLTTLLSYPLISMHSSKEIVKKSDLNACADLIVEAIKREII